LGAILSGSGSCVLAFTTAARQAAVAEALAGVYRRLAIACEVRATTFDNEGLTIARP